MPAEINIDETRPDITVDDLRPENVMEIDEVKAATGRKDVARWRYAREHEGRTDLPRSVKFGIGRQAKVVYLKRDIEAWLTGLYR